MKRIIPIPCKEKAPAHLIADIHKSRSRMLEEIENAAGSNDLEEIIFIIKFARTFKNLSEKIKEATRGNLF